jgi:inorganic phosphate transporter, PiT family
MHFFQSAAEQLGRVPWGQLSVAVWALIGLALLFDFLNGFHDSANSIATVVSTRVLSPQAAVLWAAFFNFIAFLLFHLRVADTIGKDIVAPAVVNNRVIAATLLAACFWDLLTWYWGLPTSSSHALIGGLIGAGLATAGADCLRWEGIQKTVLFIFLAPLLGMGMGLAIAVAVTWLFRRSTPRRVDTLFRRGQLLSAAFYSLGHGGNDAQKTMGIIFVLLLAFGNANPSFRWEGRYKLTEPSLHKLETGRDPLPAEGVARLAGLKDNPFDTKAAFLAALGEALPAPAAERYGAKVAAAADTAQVPTEVVLACHIAMAIGTLFGGWRIVKTMGQRIMRLRPVDGFCAETGAAATLALTVFGGVPVSTTHTITGAIVGVGALKRLSAVRWGIAGRVVWAWVLTIPGTALVAAVCWWLLPPLG